MKKRILALLLAFSMMLSLLPVSALADTGGIGSAGYASNGLTGQMPDLVMGSNGRPDLSSATQDSEGVYQGDGWRYVPQDSARNDKDTLYLDGASFNLSGASIWCNVVVSPRTTVENARFNYHDNPSGFPSVTNNGILQSCMFIECNITNNSTIQKSTIEDCIITNNATIRDSLFSINSSATLPFKFEKSGSITDSVFDFNPTTYGLTLNVHSLQASPIKALDISTASNPITYLYLRSNVFYTIGYPKIKVYCYNPDNPTGGSYKVCSINGVPATSYAPDFGYANDSYIFTVQDEDVELSSSETTAPALEMNYNGWPKTDNMTPINNVYYGDGWTYDGTTLTLKSGEYDFTHTEPRNTASSRYGDSVKCNIVVEENAEITGGILAGNSLTNSGTVKDILFIGNRITNTGTLSCLLSSWAKGTGFTRHTMTAADGSKISYTVNQHVSHGTLSKLYFTGTPTLKVKLSSNKEITCINGEANYDGLSGPDEKGYQTFTPKAGEDVVLNREPYATDLVITEGGIPDSTNREPVYEDGKVVGYKGTGWKYKNDTLTLESGSYRFIHEDGDSTSFTTDNIFCNVIVQNGVSVTGGYFSRSLVNYGTIERAAIYHDLENHNTIRNSYISSNADQIINSGSMGDCLFTHRPSVFKTYSLSEVENYPISATLNGVSASTVQSEFYFTGTPTLEVQLAKDGDFKKVTYINGKKNYGGLKGDNPYHGYTFTVEKEEDILLNDSVSRDPAPTYTLTVTGGGLVNGKTSAVVEAGDEVRLTVGEMQEGMSFNYWDLPTALIKALMDMDKDKDSIFSNKVESLTFTMPDLSEYTEDKSFTIRLDIRPAELPDDDDGPSVLGTMATVAVGGAAAGILVWQGVSLGVDSYLQLSLPGGVPVPTNRRELVVLLWETAGKPDVVLPALYGDVSAEDGELQKATRWAIDNGLVKPADESDASRFDPDRSVSKYEVARAWFKVQQMLK